MLVVLGTKKHEIKTATALKSHSHPTANYEMKQYYIVRHFFLF